MSTDDVLELTARLVALESVSGGAGERRVLDWVADWFATRGHPVSRAADEHGAAMLATAGARPLLLFAAHADTVPLGARGAWSTPPLEPTLRDGRLHGRGSSDMKAGLAAAMLAVDRGLRAGAAVGLGLTTGEELGCLGAPALAGLLAGRDVAAVVIPESTRNRVALGHRGATWLRVGANGVAAHGSAPERGTNAVLRLAGALREVAAVPLRTHPRLGRESVSVGTVAGGVGTNVVPDRCEATIDLRTVADAAELVGWWRSRDGIDDVRVELALAPVWTSPDHPLIADLLRRSGAKSAEGPVSYFTDGSVLGAALGTAAVVVWGPGDPACVHAADEYVEVALVRESAAMFDRVVVGWGPS